MEEIHKPLLWKPLILSIFFFFLLLQTNMFRIILSLTPFGSSDRRFLRLRTNMAQTRSVVATFPDIDYEKERPLSKSKVQGIHIWFVPDRFASSEIGLEAGFVNFCLITCGHNICD